MARTSRFLPEGSNHSLEATWLDSLCFQSASLLTSQFWHQGVSVLEIPMLKRAPHEHAPNNLPSFKAQLRSLPPSRNLENKQGLGFLRPFQLCWSVLKLMSQPISTNSLFSYHHRTTKTLMHNARLCHSNNICFTIYWLYTNVKAVNKVIYFLAERKLIVLLTGVK